MQERRIFVNGLEKLPDQKIKASDTVKIIVENKEFTELYKRCEAFDRTLTLHELNIVNAAYPLLVEAYRKEMWKTVAPRQNSFVVSETHFIPPIQDLRIGYECETRAQPYPDFVFSKIEDETDFEYILNGTWEIRTPYLTKDQIEKEGWIFGEVGKYGPYWEFGKKHMRLRYDFKDKILEIMNLDFSRETTRPMGYPDDSNFKGKCKDINTFRYICKLLEI